MSKPVGTIMTYRVLGSEIERGDWVVLQAGVALEVLDIEEYDNKRRLCFVNGKYEYVGHDYVRLVLA